MHSPLVFGIGSTKRISFLAARARKNFAAQSSQKRTFLDLQGKDCRKLPSPTHTRSRTSYVGRAHICSSDKAVCIGSWALEAEITKLRATKAVAVAEEDYAAAAALKTRIEALDVQTLSRVHRN